jgi:hypothetical protein
VLRDILTLIQTPRSYRVFMGLTVGLPHGSTSPTNFHPIQDVPDIVALHVFLLPHQLTCGLHVMLTSSYEKNTHFFFPILPTSKITQIQNFFLKLPLKFADFNSWFISYITHELSKNFHLNWGLLPNFTSILSWAPWSLCNFNFRPSTCPNLLN